MFSIIKTFNDHDDITRVYCPRKIERLEKKLQNIKKLPDLGRPAALRFIEELSKPFTVGRVERPDIALSRTTSVSVPKKSWQFCLFCQWQRLSEFSSCFKQGKKWSNFLHSLTLKLRSSTRWDYCDSIVMVLWWYWTILILELCFIGVVRYIVESDIFAYSHTKCN